VPRIGIESHDCVAGGVRATVPPIGFPPQLLRTNAAASQAAGAQSAQQSLFTDIHEQHGCYRYTELAE
jgi:hypothetical protein